MGQGVIIDCGVRIQNPEWVHIEDNTWIDHYVNILAGPASKDRGAYSRKGEIPGIMEGEVRIGPNCHIAPFVVLQGHGGIKVGADTTVASGSKVYSLSHHYRNSVDPSDPRIFKFSSMASKDEQSIISAPVSIGPSAAVGLNSTLLPGCVIEEGAWVASGSVISGKVSSFSVVGAPAISIEKKIK